MQEVLEVRKGMLIGEAVNVHPLVASIFTKYGLHCVGCHVSVMETVEQGCRAHGMPEEITDKMVNEVNEAIKASDLDDSSDDSEIVKLTEFAAEKLKSLFKEKSKENKALRIRVLPGGCAGFSYDFSIDTPDENDFVLEQHGVKIAIDKESVTFIKGSVLDFADSLHGAGIKISNPNAKSSCGCGNSFS